MSARFLCFSTLPFRLVAIAGLAAWTVSSQDSGALYRSGLRHFSEHQTAVALQELSESVRLKPDFAEAWKALGVVSAAQGDYEAAEAPFRTACQLQPALPDACFYYGRTLYLLNRFRPALEVLQRILKTDPNNSQVHRLIALSFEALGDTVESAIAFQKAVEWNRGSAPNEDPAIDYGVFLFRQGRAEPALEPLQSALKRHPDASRAYLELGCVFLALDRLADAQQHLERAVTLDPQSGRAHLLLGKVYLRQGKTEAGEREMRQGSLTVK